MSLQDLCKAVETGDQDKGKDLAQKLVDGGTDPLEIIAALTKVMDEIGEKFARLEIFLPEMMMSGEAMGKVVEVLTPHLKAGGGGEPKGRVVLGTVKGDLHEIGKNIVKLMLQAGFFEVRDLGVDADPITFIKQAEDYGADITDLVTVALQKLDAEKEDAFDDHLDEIREALESEFAEKTGGSSARIAALLKYDPVVEKAVNILDANDQYQEILVVKK